MMTIHSNYDPAACDDIWFTFNEPKDAEEEANKYNPFEEDDCDRRKID